jgi:peptidoglycan/LPS O-acetylase OafA/YrhL
MRFTCVTPLHNTPSSSRLTHLDSLRGIAAIAVAFHHTMDSFYGIPLNNGYINAFAGISPVFFFFLLSGFVLSRSIDNEASLNKVILFCYFIRRFFRLYPAVFVSVVFCILITKSYTYPVSWDDANWLQSYHCGVISIVGKVDYLKEFLLSSFLLNPPLWSIRVEFSCSLLLPLLIILINRYSFLIAPVGIVFALWFWKGVGFPKFIFLFYLGLLVQRNLVLLSNISTQASKLLLILTLITWLVSMATGFDFLIEAIIIVFLFALLVPCKWPSLRGFLVSDPMRFLGRISFSLYLLHCPLLYCFWSTMKFYCPKVMAIHPPLIPAMLVFVLSLATAILAATLCEEFVEQPFNLLGHKLSRTLRARSQSTESPLF